MLSGHIPVTSQLVLKRIIDMPESDFGPYLHSLNVRFREGDAFAEAKEEESSNIQLIQNVILAIGSGDIETVGRLLTDDVRLEIHSGKVLPFIEHADGKRAFLEAMGHNFGQLQDQRPEIVSVVAQGDTVVVIAREQGELLASGERYEVFGMHRYLCRDGKIALVQEILAPA
jgi:ketosteroid isomerase-like protein